MRVTICAGNLFQGRYKAVVVDGQDAAYFRTVCDYIHLNPVRAGLLAADAALKSFVWSSFPVHAASPEKRPRWLKSDRVLAEAGEADTGSERRAYRMALEKRAVEERGGEAIEEGMRKALRRGWCFGSEEFRAALVEKMGKKDGSVHTSNGSAIKRTHDEQEAERLIAIGLKAPGVSAVDLPKHPKGSAEKIALASVARQRTSVTNAWLAERLSMGAATRVSRDCGEAAGRSDIQNFAMKIEMAIGEN